jgi:hypothetical protein
MCCFSRNVKLVSDTNIFARGSGEGRQYLVYSMMLDAKEDLAMILPIPVPRDSKEDAVRFINLEEYPRFFSELRAGFPVPRSLVAAAPNREKSAPANKLAVVEVGSFEASFVPAIKDFARLDERFRLPTDVWEKLPQYKNYGFAVFKLKKGASKVHPMAFDFPRANPDQIFFPTVHIHDGKIHPRAKFDHALYCQRAGNDKADLNDWEESTQPAGLFMNMKKAKGLLVAEEHCYLKQLRGQHKNEDVIL